MIKFNFSFLITMHLCCIYLIQSDKSNSTTKNDDEIITNEDHVFLTKQ